MYHKFSIIMAPNASLTSSSHFILHVGVNFFSLFDNNSFFNPEISV
uniref:Uncharacterized protein n=1 Tax=Anguilla anguilla TaxID=7936 RepID=A0A0E9U579_ANGAN